MIILCIHFLIVRLGRCSGTFPSFSSHSDPALYLVFYPWRLELLPALALGLWCFFVAEAGSRFHWLRMSLGPGLPHAPSPGTRNRIITSIIRTSGRGSSSNSFFLCFLPRLAFAFELPTLRF